MKWLFIDVMVSLLGWSCLTKLLQENEISKMPLRILAMSAPRWGVPRNIAAFISLKTVEYSGLVLASIIALLISNVHHRYTVPALRPNRPSCELQKRWRPIVNHIENSSYRSVSVIELLHIVKELGREYRNGQSSIGRQQVYGGIITESCKSNVLEAGLLF